MELYNNTAQMTLPIPKKYSVFNLVPNSTILLIPVRMTEMAVAYPFRTASAYFSTVIEFSRMQNYSSGMSNILVANVHEYS